MHLIYNFTYKFLTHVIQFATTNKITYFKCDTKLQQKTQILTQPVSDQKRGNFTKDSYFSKGIFQHKLIYSYKYAQKKPPSGGFFVFIHNELSKKNLSQHPLLEPLFPAVQKNAL